MNIKKFSLNIYVLNRQDSQIFVTVSSLTVDLKNPFLLVLKSFYEAADIQISKGSVKG